MHIFYKKYLKVLSSLLPLMLALLALPATAQLKLGGYPVLRNDAILELGSGKKGLLLPRVNNSALTSHPLDTAAAGMLVFNTNDQSLYIKKFDALTPWTRVNDGTNLLLSGLGDANILAPANNQLLRYNAGKWQNWTPDFLTNTQLFTFSGGDVEGNTALSGNITLNLRNITTAGTFTKVTVNAKGLVTGGAALAAADITGGSNNYIQNQTAAAQAASFRVNGAGTVGSLTATGAVTAASATVSGATGTNTLAVTGAATAGSLDVGGTFKLGAQGSTLVNIQKTTVTVADNTLFAWDDNPRLVVGTLPTGIVLTGNDNIILNPRAALTARMGVAWSRVTDAANRQITICFTNTGNGARVGSVTFDVTIISN